MEKAILKIITTTFFVTLLLMPMTAFATGIAERSTSPDGKTVIECRCDDEWHKDCEVTATGPNNNKFSIWSQVPAPNIIWHSNDLAEIRISCGSPCFYSRFYLSEGKVSEPIGFVVAVITGKNLAVRAGDETLEVIRIFEKNTKPIQTIKLDYAPSATIVTVLQEVKFVGGNMLFIRYLSGNDYVEKETSVSLNID